MKFLKNSQKYKYISPNCPKVQFLFPPPGHGFLEEYIPLPNLAFLGGGGVRGVLAKVRLPSCLPSGRKERASEERREKNDLYHGHFRFGQQPQAAHALRSDQYTLEME